MQVSLDVGPPLLGWVLKHAFMEHAAFSLCSILSTNRRAAVCEVTKHTVERQVLGLSLCCIDSAAFYAVRHNMNTDACIAAKVHTWDIAPRYDLYRYATSCTAVRVVAERGVVPGGARRRERPPPRMLAPYILGETVRQYRYNGTKAAGNI